MKKILLALALLVSGFQIQAQIPGFNIGPKIGYNTRKFSTDLATLKSDPEGAFQFGALEDRQKNLCSTRGKLCS
jgi:hypothetical protein